MARCRILLVALALAGALWLAGCASALRSAKPERPPFLDASMSMQAASEAVAAGKATKAEVLATLGPATVVKFDSGFEVWVYRAKSPDAEVAPAEFVILFTPSGIVSKTRIRP
jgi:hypothetical protein